MSCDIDQDLVTRSFRDPEGVRWVKEHCAPPRNVIQVDGASVLYFDEQHRPWRLPRLDPMLPESSEPITGRVCREVCTERDLLNVEGTFYELPAENAGGFAKIRPIASHGRRINDFATYRGLLFLAGAIEKADHNEHVLATGSTRRLWVGAVDDLWKFGKPRGHGGPWRNTEVFADRPSDPYLMTGYDRKELVLHQRRAKNARMRVEVDYAGNGDWSHYAMFDVADKPVRHTFPEAFAAYWVRIVSDQDCTATALLKYE